MRLFKSQLRVPRQIMAVDYVMVIDALNRPLRFYLETVRSKKVREDIGAAILYGWQS